MSTDSVHYVVETSYSLGNGRRETLVYGPIASYQEAFDLGERLQQEASGVLTIAIYQLAPVPS